MPDPTAYDLDFRPESYWTGNKYALALSRIKGAARREQARAALIDGVEFDPKNPLFMESLSAEDRSAAGAFHPSLMGGEYLPDFEECEVEIARIVLDSVMADTYSFRASPSGRGIKYRMLDDNCAYSIRVRPAQTRVPLTQGQLIEALSTARGFFSRKHRGHSDDLSPRGFLGNNRSMWEDEVESLLASGDFEGYCERILEVNKDRLRFVSVSSEFYPDVGRWFDEDLEECLIQMILKDAETHWPDVARAWLIRCIEAPRSGLEALIHSFWQRAAAGAKRHAAGVDEGRWLEAARREAGRRALAMKDVKRLSKRLYEEMEREASGGPLGSA